MPISTFSFELKEWKGAGSEVNTDEECHDYRSIDSTKKLSRTSSYVALKSSQFWNVMQKDYEFLMNDHIADFCNELKSEIDSASSQNNSSNGSNSQNILEFQESRNFTNFENFQSKAVNTHSKCNTLHCKKNDSINKDIERNKESQRNEIVGQIKIMKKTLSLVDEISEQLALISEAIGQLSNVLTECHSTTSIRDAISRLSKYQKQIEDLTQTFTNISKLLNQLDSDSTISFELLEKVEELKENWKQIWLKSIEVECILQKSFLLAIKKKTQIYMREVGVNFCIVFMHPTTFNERAETTVMLQNDVLFNDDELFLFDLFLHTKSNYSGVENPEFWTFEEANKIGGYNQKLTKYESRSDLNGDQQFADILPFESDEYETLSFVSSSNASLFRSLSDSNLFDLKRSPQLIVNRCISCFTTFPAVKSAIRSSISAQSFKKKMQLHSMNSSPYLPDTIERQNYKKDLLDPYAMVGTHNASTSNEHSDGWSPEIKKRIRYVKLKHCCPKTINSKNLLVLHGNEREYDASEENIETTSSNTTTTTTTDDDDYDQVISKHNNKIKHDTFDGFIERIDRSHKFLSNVLKRRHGNKLSDEEVVRTCESNIDEITNFRHQIDENIGEDEHERRMNILTELILDFRMKEEEVLCDNVKSYSCISIQRRLSDFANDLDQLSTRLIFGQCWNIGQLEEYLNGTKRIRSDLDECEAYLNSLECMVESKLNEWTNEESKFVKIMLDSRKSLIGSLAERIKGVERRLSEWIVSWSQFDRAFDDVRQTLLKCDNELCELDQNTAKWTRVHSMETLSRLQIQKNLSELSRVYGRITFLKSSLSQFAAMALKPLRYKFLKRRLANLSEYHAILMSSCELIRFSFDEYAFSSKESSSNVDSDEKSDEKTSPAHHHDQQCSTADSGFNEDTFTLSQTYNRRPAECDGYINRQSDHSPNSTTPSRGSFEFDAAFHSINKTEDVCVQTSNQCSCQNVPINPTKQTILNKFLLFALLMLILLLALFFGFLCFPKDCCECKPWWYMSSSQQAPPLCRSPDGTIYA